MESTGPATYRLVLGKDLKELREGAGISREETATELHWHVSKVSKIEQGQATLRPDEVTRLLDFFGASPEDITRVEELAAHARKRGSFGKVADWARSYLGLEADSKALKFFDPELVHGLFQTEAYALAVVKTSPVVAAVDIPRVVDSRMRRQALLDRPNPPEVTFILGQAGLKRVVGDHQIMAGQIARLIELADRPNITIRVHEFDAGEHASLGTGFVLLDVPVGNAVQSWAYVEHLTRADLLDGESHVNTYRLAFDTLAETSLNPRESLALMRSAMQDMEKVSGRGGV